MPSKVDFLRAKVQAVLSALEKASAKEREGRVSTHVAKDFNEVVKQIGEGFPDASGHLPKPICSSTKERFQGLSDVRYVDLVIMAEQVMRILSVIESHG
jgi:4-hydroxy-3-methylbut-2-enyl diphosphate reductase IspH